jgi:hypothetical protein
MISISPETYAGIAARLLSAVEKTDYFNGRIDCDGPQGRAVLTCSLVVYRKPGTDPPPRPLEKIIPVWWDFSLEVDGMIRATDFGWSGIVPYLF